MEKHTTSISFNDELKNKIIAHLSGTQSISQFVFGATEEKVRRLETKDDRARMELMKRDLKVLAPVVKKMIMEGLI